METTFRFSCVEAGAWPKEAGETSSYPLSSTEQEAHRHRGCVVRSMKGRREPHPSFLSHLAGDTRLKEKEKLGDT